MASLDVSIATFILTFLSCFAVPFIFVSIISTVHSAFLLFIYRRKHYQTEQKTTMVHMNKLSVTESLTESGQSSVTFKSCSWDDVQFVRNVSSLVALLLHLFILIPVWMSFAPFAVNQGMDIELLLMIYCCYIPSGLFATLFYYDHELITTKMKKILLGVLGFFILLFVLSPIVVGNTSARPQLTNMFSHATQKTSIEIVQNESFNFHINESVSHVVIGSKLPLSRVSKHLKSHKVSYDDVEFDPLPAVLFDNMVEFMASRFISVDLPSTQPLPLVGVSGEAVVEGKQRSWLITVNHPNYFNFMVSVPDSKEEVAIDPGYEELQKGPFALVFFPQDASLTKSVFSFTTSSEECVTVDFGLMGLYSDLFDSETLRFIHQLLPP
ncbi:hypothetical protein GEMRC1_007956 [Eukaryota sp. GEM-RC1]